MSINHQLNGIRYVDLTYAAQKLFSLFVDNMTNIKFDEVF